MTRIRRLYYKDQEVMFSDAIIVPLQIFVGFLGNGKSGYRPFLITSQVTSQGTQQVFVLAVDLHNILFCFFFRHIRTKGGCRSATRIAAPLFPTVQLTWTWNQVRLYYTRSATIIAAKMGQLAQVFFVIEIDKCSLTGHSHKAIQRNLQCQKGKVQLSEMGSRVKIGSPPGFLCNTNNRSFGI